MSTPVPQPPRSNPIHPVPPTPRPTRSRTEIRIKAVELAIQMWASPSCAPGVDMFGLARRIEQYVTGEGEQ